MSRKRFFWWMKRSIAVVRSFKVKELFLNVDTGDYIYNAYLHPVFYFLGNDHRTLYVNYIGENRFRIIIKNRLINIIFAFIKP